MKKKIIKRDIVCLSCKGIGLISGRGELRGCVVVCHTCNGTGCQKYFFEYEEFISRKKPLDFMKRVHERNPCGRVSSDKRHRGMDIKDWEQGKPFPPKSENRLGTCPY